MTTNFVQYLLKTTQASVCVETEIIQSLWSGYGNISRYQLEGGDLNTVVVKHIKLNESLSHPRGWNTNISHLRKVKSYEVETHWYEKWSHQCTDKSRIPRFLGSFAQGNEQWIILEDLDAYYPMRKRNLSLVEVKACLKWLGNFHATFMHQKPSGLWPIGTYWHLDTRPDEFEKIEHSLLKSKASTIDRLLNECRYQTIVHGDAKVANFCFSNDGLSIAAVDFQYVGGGCGMKDVAYFIGSCLGPDDCDRHQEELLDYYFGALSKGLEGVDIDIEALRQEWTTMFPFACADFTRFMLGWMPSHQKINHYSLKLMESVLSRLTTPYS